MQSTGVFYTGEKLYSTCTYISSIIMQIQWPGVYRSLVRDLAQFSWMIFNVLEQRSVSLSVQTTVRVFMTVSMGKMLVLFVKVCCR